MQMYKPAVPSISPGKDVFEAPFADKTFIVPTTFDRVCLCHGLLGFPL